MPTRPTPAPLDFQLGHLLDLYEKLPRTLPEDLQAMRDALTTLRAVDLQSIAHPAHPSAETHTTGKSEFRRLDRSLAKLADLLPAWSNNLSGQYFSHARTLPTSMG